MRLIDADELKKKIDEVQYTQEFCIEHQIDYSISMQMLGMVIDNAPTADDWQKYSDNLWKNAYERGKADAYEQAKQKVTVSVKVGNETVETIEISGDAVRWSSSSL